MEAMTEGRTQGPGRHARRSRRRVPPLVFIVLVGLAAVAVVFAVAVLLQRDDRPHGPYLIGAWSFGDGESLRRAVAAGAIDEVSCDWLQSRADGSVTAPKEASGFADLARDLDCRVFVTLTDYDEAGHSFKRSISDAILASAATRRRHAQAVVAWAHDRGYDGVDVDWEAVDGTQRERFSMFVEELVRQAHAAGLKVAVDVYPKLSEPGGWDGPRSQDWARLGRAVDQFRIMTYNYSGSWSGPGPMSPPVWMDRVLTFAETKVEPHKIVMGVGFYGRAWRGDKTIDLVWSDVHAIIAAGVQRRTRGVSHELVLLYRREGQRGTAYFPDARAMKAKLRVLTASHPGIRGIYCWRMGQEDPAVWRVIHDALHTRRAQSSGGSSSQ